MGFGVQVRAHGRTGGGRRARLQGVVGLAFLALAFAAAPVFADEGEEATLDPAPAADAPVSLPPVVVRAPRAEAGPGLTQALRVVTPLRIPVEVFDVPAAVTVIDGSTLSRRRLVRSMPDALLRVPGVSVQKTAPLQSSPYIRGFTAYHNVMLIDGIRLNHSAMRAGPNQYWSTIDPYTIGRLEITRGPNSVLYGSDAVGGVVNAVLHRRSCFACGTHWGGGVRLRYATGEDALAARVQVEGNHDGFGWLAGVTGRTFGAIESGAGALPNTGGIEELDGDVRFDWRLSRRWSLVLAYQRVRQEDAPRTEQTIFSVPFRGTRIGRELRRDHDQERDLAYARVVFDGGRGPIQRGQLTVSYHRHAEERDRLRTGDRRDLSGFTVDQYGVQLQLESRTRLGAFTYGVEYTHDEVDSFRRDSVGGALTLTHVQGPVGDEGSYDLLGIYVQDRIQLGRLDLYAGARFTYAAAAADRVDNPAVAGADPATPGNIISIDNDWTQMTGSLRGVYHLSPCWNVYGGVSQAFRAPSLHDLTSLEATSVIERPSPGLEPEQYLNFELGVKTEQPRVSAEVTGWVMRLDDTIIRSPTGVVVAGTPEVRKDNIGDGWVWGFEAQAAVRVARSWVAFANLSDADSEVDELDPATGSLVSSNLSRDMPLQAVLGLRWEPPRARFWAQAELVHAAKADELSLRDIADTRRIPPGGTPSWTVLNLRAGARVWRKAFASVSLENVFDENYRIHGSGQNEPGRSLVIGLDIDL